MKMINKDKKVLIFTWSFGISKGIQEALDISAITVMGGAHYEKRNLQTYVIDFYNTEDYLKLFEDLQEYDIYPDVILHALSEVSIEDKINAAYRTIYYLVKSFMDTKPMKTVFIGYLYEGSSSDYDAVSGFLKTLSNENPLFKWKMLQVERLSDYNLVAKELARECSVNEQVRYINNRRQVRKVSYLENILPSDGGVAFKENGVYVIFGGGGGLGRLFARHILSHVCCKLILLGRKGRGVNFLETFSAYNRFGSDISYQRVDITNNDELKHTIESILKIYGRISGIVHSAGNISDSYIYRQDYEAEKEIIEPKIKGLHNIISSMRNEPFDFLILNSSLTSLIGTAGQSHYAYANAYFDSFASEWNRKHMQPRIISINWPLWENGGMNLDPLIQEMSSEETGLYPLPDKEGIDSLIKILAGNIDRPVVAYGKEKEIFELLYEGQKDELFPEKNPPRKNAEIHLTDPTLDDYLKKILSDATEVPISDIDINEKYERYGIESVSIIKMIKVMEERFGRLPKTIFYEYITLKQLREYLKATYKDKIKDVVVRGDDVSVDQLESVNVFDSEPELCMQVQKDSVAIIGLSGRYPEAENKEIFWENLKNGKDCISEIQSEYWQIDDYFDGEKKSGSKQIYSKWGGFIKDADCFDTLFFHIPPREAEIMDPQERVFLETAYHTLEDAGYTAESLAGKRVGVYVGAMYGHYQFYGVEEMAKGNYVTPGSTFSSIANRVSYFFDFHGPSIAVDTMCSSSLSALHLACEAMKAGNIDYALVGGVNLTLHPYKYMQLCQGHFLSTDGKCRSFGKDGDGYVPGEGVGAVLIKPMSKALADRDYIYGRICAVEMNHGGKTSGYTVPNLNAQSELIKTSLAKAGIKGSKIGYIEAHGTGTSLGDPIEIAALTNAFGDEIQEGCPLGSVKSNIGHLESAAGIAGLTKVLLQFQYEKLVPSIHTEQLNPNIDFENSPFYVQKELKQWSKSNNKTAAISAFGAGGTNVHAIIQEVKRNPIKHINDHDKLFLFSANSKELLLKLLSNFVEFIGKREDISLTDMAYTLQVGRVHFKYRVALIAADFKELVDKLNVVLQDSADAKGIFISWNTNSLQIEGNQGQLHVQTLIDESNLKTLANLWVFGKQIPWEKLYQSEFCYKVPLPLYPFERKKYWITKKLHKDRKETHIITDDIVIDNIINEGNTYTGNLKLDPETWYLKEHKVKGVSVLPGATHIEIAFTLLKEMADAHMYMLEEIIFYRAAVFREPGELVVRAVNENDRVTFELLSSDRGNEKIFSKGAFQRKSLTKKGNITIVDIAGRKQLYSNECDHDQIYREFTKKEILYGLAYQRIDRVYYNENSLLGIISIPKVENGVRSLSNHSQLLMDAIFQCFSRLISDEEGICLPAAVGGLHRYTPILNRAYVVGERKDNGKFWAKVYNDDEELCLEIDNIMFKPMDSQDDKYLYVPAFEEIEPTVCNKMTDGMVLLYPDGDEKAERLFLNLYGDNIHYIKLGIENKKVNENRFEIDLSEPEQIKKVFNKIGKINRVCFWGVTQSSIGIKQVEETEKILQKTVYLLINILKIMTELSVNNFKIITNNAYGIKTNEYRNPFSAAIVGMADSAQKEIYQFEIQTVDIDLEDHHSDEDLINIVEKAVGYADSEISNCLIRDGRYYRRLLEPYSEKIEFDSGFKMGGTYLIIGGRGGIGLVFAEYLADKYSANVILTGRSPKNDQTKEIINKLSSTKGIVNYEQCDITKSNDLRVLIANIKERFHGINGVIHSAIVLKDKLLINTNQTEYKEVLEPKTIGMVHLLNAIADEPLDFLLCFSSMQSFSGGIGQSNYASASAFEDAIAYYAADQMPFKVKIMNWGFWGSTGIVANRKYNQIMKQKGVYSIEPADGIKAVECLLSSSVIQMAAIRADIKAHPELNIKTHKQFADNRLISQFSHLFKENEFIHMEANQQEYLDSYSARRLMDFFISRDIFLHHERKYKISDIENILHILPKYKQLVEAMLSLLCDKKYLKKVGDSEYINVLSTADFSGQEIEFVEIEPHKRLLNACVDGMGDVLSGQQAYTSVMFPGNSAYLVENIYKNNAIADYYNDLLSQCLHIYLMEKIRKYPDRKLNILEVGAGTGGTTQVVLEKLREYQNNICYYYTDISLSFINYGKQHYKNDSHFMKFLLLDIEKVEKNKEILPKSIDVIIGSNVLHATKNIQQSLQKINYFIKPGGLLILNEVMKVQLFTTMTFGLTDGWWAFEDNNRIKGSPLLDANSWVRVMKEAGFSDIWLLDRNHKNEQSPQNIIVGKVSEIEVAVNKPRMGSSETMIKDIFATVLKMDINELDTDQTYDYYGIDSLLIMEISDQLKERFNTAGMILYEYGTIRELSTYIDQIRDGEDLTINDVKEEKSYNSNIVHDMEPILDQMTEDEIDKLLMTYLEE